MSERFKKCTFNQNQRNFTNRKENQRSKLNLHQRSGNNKLESNKRIEFNYSHLLTVLFATKADCCKYTIPIYLLTGLCISYIGNRVFQDGESVQKFSVQSFQVQSFPATFGNPSTNLRINPGYNISLMKSAWWTWRKRFSDIFFSASIGPGLSVLLEDWFLRFFFVFPLHLIWICGRFFSLLIFVNEYVQNHSSIRFGVCLYDKREYGRFEFDLQSSLGREDLNESAIFHRARFMDVYSNLLRNGRKRERERVRKVVRDHCRQFRKGVSSFLESYFYTLTFDETFDTFHSITPQVILFQNQLPVSIWKQNL